MKYIALALLIVCSACATPARWAAVPPTATLAVAHFIHPQYDWELMAGVLPEEQSVITPESMAALDAQMIKALDTAKHQVMPQGVVRQCEEIVTASKERSRFASVEYWRSVAKCMKVDYLLVPFVTNWHEREGGEWGVTHPASLIVDLYLIDAASGELRRFHFEEEQKGLAENLLQGRRFVKRKGRWVTPLEIAAEAMEEGIRTLGL